MTFEVGIDKEDVVLEGQYIEVAFQGKILSNQREMKKWLNVTGMLPNKIENGDSPNLGITGWFVHY